MNNTKTMVILCASLATTRGSFAVGDNYPCDSQEEAERMVDAGYAKWPDNRLADSKALDSANQKVAALEDENKTLKETLAASNSEGNSEEIANLKGQLATVQEEKIALQQTVEKQSKELIAVKKKLKTAENTLAKNKAS